MKKVQVEVWQRERCGRGKVRGEKGGGGEM